MRASPTPVVSIADLNEAVVFKNAITLDKGSKRRLRQVRWKMIEVFSLALLAIFLLAMSLLYVLWVVRHEDSYSEPTRVPHVTVRVRA